MTTTTSSSSNPHPDSHPDSHPHPNPPILIRAPTTHPPNFIPPTPSQLHGVWHVTHSTLPLWKNKRNVTVTYGPLDPLTVSARGTTTTSGDSASGPATSTIQDRLDDTVSYQTLTSDKIKTIHGIDTAELGHPGGGVWNWRGTGFLRLASSHWEIIGYGRTESASTSESTPASTPASAEDEGNENENRNGKGKEWAVTYFASTIFSPAGVDIYSRERGAGAAPEAVVQAVREGLLAMEDPGMRKLGGELYAVRMD